VTFLQLVVSLLQIRSATAAEQIAAGVLDAALGALLPETSAAVGAETPVRGILPATCLAWDEGLVLRTG
jgi:hypothetical protein